jgi:hypothetical protein
VRRVIIESPYAGDVDRNVEYARQCLKDSLSRGEAPIASHLLYPQVLDDNNPEQRSQGIRAGLEWRSVAQAQVFYLDLGWSKGMIYAHEQAKNEGRTVVYRYLYDAPREVQIYD